MKYCHENIHGGCWLEFQKGDFSQNLFWLDSSLYLHDDTAIELSLLEFFFEVIPHFAHYGSTTITQAQWERVIKAGTTLNPESRAALAEIDQWARECFQTHDRFTILGI